MTNIPGGFNYIQQESIQFNNPVSQASMEAIGSSVNGVLGVVLPVGSIIPTMLTAAQFQAQLGNPSPQTWVAADGTSYPTSTYATVSGNSSVPDLRGVFLRGKNNGRSTGSGNPDGDLALGTYQADQFYTHDHGYSDPGHSHGLTQPMQFRSNNYQAGTPLSAWDISGGANNTITSQGTNITFNAQGGNETRARNITVNYMIRIN